MFDKDTLENTKKALEKWEQGVLKQYLKKQEERKPNFQTWSELPVNRIYTPLDLEERRLDYVNNIGFPGEFPNVRGIEPTMYRGKLWERVQLSGFGLPEDTNKRIKYLIEQGQTGFYIALDRGYVILFRLGSGRRGRPEDPGLQCQGLRRHGIEKRPVSGSHTEGRRRLLRVRRRHGPRPARRIHDRDDPSPQSR